MYSGCMLFDYQFKSEFNCTVSCKNGKESGRKICLVEWIVPLTQFSKELNASEQGKTHVCADTLVLM